MKTLVAFLGLLLSTAVSSADETEITSKIVETRGQDDKVNLRMETFYRGTNKVMVVTSRRNAKNKMIVESRQYFADEKLVTVEKDRDGDGRLEVVRVFAPDGVSSQTFLRDADGSVRPARKLNRQELELIYLAKKQLDKGELDVAELNLRTVIAAAPHDEAAHYYLSLVEEAQQRISRSRHTGWRFTP